MRAPARPIEHFNFEIPMENELPASANLIQKIQRLAIAAHHDMLSVVHEIAGLVIDKRVGAATQSRLAFQYSDAKASRAKSHACRQAGETSSDHNDVFGFDGHEHQAGTRTRREPAHARPTR